MTKRTGKVVVVCNNNVSIMNKIVLGIKLHDKEYYGAMIAGWLRRSSDGRIAAMNSTARKGSDDGPRKIKATL